MFLLANGETQIKKCARASQRGKAAKLSGGISVGAQPTNFDLQRVRVGGMPFGTPKMVNYEDPICGIWFGKGRNKFAHLEKDFLSKGKNSIYAWKHAYYFCPCSEFRVKSG